MVRYPTLEDEVKAVDKVKESLKTAMKQEDTKSNAALYLLLRAADHFHAANNRFPGSLERQVGAQIVLPEPLLLLD